MMEVAIGLLILASLFGVPVAFSLTAAALVYYMGADQPLTVVVQRLNSGLDSFPLMAVPFFVLAGAAMANGGIASRLLGFADTLVGHRNGALGQVNVLNSMLMGGMSGSGVADAAIDCKVLVPVMERSGYPRPFATALSAATAVIAPIMPPSIALILYGLIARVSVGRLFLAGIVPAILLAVGLSVAVSVISKKRGYGAERDQRPPIPEVLRSGRKASWALMMPVLLVVGLRAGVFTPTELGAFAALYALLIGLFVHRELTWSGILEVLRESVVSSASIMLILAAGIAFAGAVTVEGIPQDLARTLVEFTDNPYVMLLILNVGLLILGMFLDGITLIVLLAPILGPAVAALGVDPVHFGLIMTVNVVIGAVTPPLGVILFTATSITRTTLAAVSRETIPFLIASVVVLLLITFIPALTLAVPDWLMP